MTEEDMLCPYEDVIEEQPLLKDRNDESCPLFGHQCPGGREQAIKCRENGMSIGEDE